MLKKILIVALILNTLYILPSQYSSAPRYDVAVICTLGGVICAWLAYKDFKKGLQASKEFNHHLKILNAMGIKVYKVSKTTFGFGYLVTAENYRMDIPSDLSQQEEEKAKEH